MNSLTKQRTKSVGSASTKYQAQPTYTIIAIVYDRKTIEIRRHT